MKVILKLSLILFAFVFSGKNPVSAQNQKKTARYLKHQVKGAVFFSGINLKILGPYDPKKKKIDCSVEISIEGIIEEDYSFVFVLSKDGTCNHGDDVILLYYNSKGELVDVFHLMENSIELKLLYNFLPTPIYKIYYKKPLY